MKPPRSTDK